MRLILSRKGFDSRAGGVPSPVFQDQSGTMVAMPIPSKQKNNFTYDQISKAGLSLGHLVGMLPRSKVTAVDNAHLDPDLERSSLPRSSGWKPAFGEAGIAQRHLKKQSIGKGDLFLFFGSFRLATLVDQKIAFSAQKPIHAIFGWLLVEEVVELQSIRDPYPLCIADHPHVKNDYRNNTIYIATPDLTSLDSSLNEIPGGGAFDKFSPGLLLSAPNQSQSVWRLPAWFLHSNPALLLTYHPHKRLKNGKARWTPLSSGTCHLTTVGQGQEFVLDCQHYPLAMNWVIQILQLANGNFR
jgi:Nucleotide modification associated domain 3